MPKGMGGKKKKGGKKRIFEERELQIADAEQAYGQVLRLLGDSRLEIQCTDGLKRVGHIRGTMRKKVWIGMGDVVLVSKREFEDEKCDIILKYTEDEVRKLKSLNEIPESIKLPENEDKPNNDGDIVFGSDDEGEPQMKKKWSKDAVSESDSMSEEEKDFDV